jgi:uncharacterized protein (DUF885 family)
VPGHHLQLSIARLIPDPIRSILADSPQNEGWGLYAEEMFWQAGGFGSRKRAEYNTLRSYRARIRRVVYDVNIETGRWTLQQAADYKYASAPGKGTVDEDVLRSINWPTQLIGYFAGKTQIVALRASYQQKHGQDPHWERDFHDAFLQVGSVPIALARAKLMHESVPEL